MKRIVCTSGCFNLIHPGHIQFLENAAKLGDELHVFLDSDERNESQKNDKAIFDWRERCRLLEALSCVTRAYHYVGPGEDFDRDLYNLRQAWLGNRSRQIIFAKAGDYTFKTLCQDQVKAVENVSGIVTLLDYDKRYSTTKIFEEIRNGVHVVKSE